MGQGRQEDGARALFIQTRLRSDYGKYDYSEILDTFDYYDAYVAHLDAWDSPNRDERDSAEVKFRIRLYGVESSRDVTESAPGENHESRRKIFQRVYRAYVFRGVREGHEAGLDYLSICYAFCRRIAALERGDPWRRFSMHTYAMLKTGQPLTIDVDWSIGNPERVSLKKKLAFLRAERRKRQEFTGSWDRPSPSETEKGSVA